ncbi:membrane-associating domain-containing protein [Camillea tinctor]|nr:membrane-associating domain-containing protein [Camillea tinctor]
MAFNFVTIAHIVAAIFSIIELGLTAYIVNWYTGSYYNGGYYWGGWSPSRVNFMLFNSIWSLLVLAYVGIVPLYAASLFRKIVALGLNVITTIFWFAGSIALAVFVGGPWDCGANRVCGSLEAAVAFGFFLWAIFTFLTVLDALEALRSRGHNVGGPTKPQAHPGA